MLTFLISIVVLVVGYLFYGVFVERIFSPDDRKTPAVSHPDGVDYIPLPLWKTFLIQVLNIAGLGPIFGALLGAMWGPVVYLWIVFGTIFAGAVHDFLSGMISERNDGASISEIVGIYLGTGMRQVMRVFSVVLLVMVGTVFMVGPAGLLALLTPEALSREFWLIVILIYYFLATLLPIDKIIGKVYPFFGVALIVMCLGVGGGTLLLRGNQMPELWSNFGNQHAAGLPIWPLMFITVACGAISGFHATQSPIMARCMTSEREGRTLFYGAMVAEGIIAMIWAAAGVAFYESGGTKALFEAAAAVKNNQATMVYQISTGLLGTIGGILAMIGVIACPITSGDTAFRSARLTLADWIRWDQKDIHKRLLLAVPLLGAGFIISRFDYGIVWRYFSWSNQTLAMIALWAGAVYLAKNNKNHWIAAIPATLMSAVSCTYILVANEGFGPMLAGLQGGASLAGAERIALAGRIAYPIGLLFALCCLGLFIAKVRRMPKTS